MPPQQWSAKRERQYEHIKEGLEDRGESDDTAEEIAARTVNKERARAGEARTAKLYNEARRKSIEGRSKMNKRELERAVGR